MSRIRIFLVWLVMAAVPLQGLAAASMLFCGVVGTGAVAQSVMHHGDSSAAGSPAAHDHSTHGHSQVQDKKSSGDTDSRKVPAADHKCGVCASCCHAVAITQLPQPAVFAAAPQALLNEPFVLIYARPSQVPDKPPRS